MLDYPKTRIVDASDSLFGKVVRDPYRWLEDVRSPEVLEWMRAQDALTRRELDALPERDALVARYKELFYLDTISAPRHRGTRYFYSRRHADKEKAIVYWKEGKAGKERVLLDPNGWDADKNLSLGSVHYDWSGKRVAYMIRENNSDEATLRVMDVASGKDSKIDVIEGAKYAAPSWTPASDGFYYVWLPTDPSISAAERPGYAEVRFHKLGDDPKKDRLVHEKLGDPSTFLGADVSRDGRYLVLTIYHGWTSNEVYFRDLKGPPTQSVSFKKDWTPLAVGAGAHYNVEAFRGRFYVHTDEGAPKWRVFEVDPAHPERARWKEIVPENPDATLDGVSVLGGRLLLKYLKNASSALEVRELDGRKVRDVALPGIGTVDGPIGRDDEDEAYFAFQSFTMPVEIHAMSVQSGKTDLYARVQVPVDPSPYLVEQTWFTSKDGTRVSMFVVRRKDLQKDGRSRAMLYGYGGFQSTETPVFMGSIYPWLERGGIYAIANLRGGAEYGEAWHQAGMLLKKQNVFDDFIAAAEHLIHEGYTSAEHLAIQGASNGGLLVGAALTQRPDLFAAALCGVPLLDMVRYPLFGSGKTWVSEYGSPEDPAQFEVLFGYSPYHHVKAGTRYPAVLLLSSESDDRVDPMHARKFAAALQAASTGGPVLLRLERKAGHGGADLVKANVEKYADQYAFALARTRGSLPAANAKPKQ